MPHLETDRRLLSLNLICVFLILLMNCCSRSSLKPARPMCDGRPFASPLFRRLAGRGPIFRGFPFRWALQFALSLTRCLILQDAAPCSRKDPLHECGCPHDTLSYLFFTALWFRQSQSILTQVQQTNDIDLTCYKTLPTKSVTCLQVGPMSLEWPVALPAGSDQSCLSSSHEDPNDEYPEDALPTLPHLRKKYMGRMSFSKPFRYWFRDSGYMIRLYQATQMQEALPHAFIKTFCLTMLL